MLSAVLVSLKKWRAVQTIETFFDAVDLIASRMPGLEHLVVEITLLGLAIFGACALFRHHPH